MAKKFVLSAARLHDLNLFLGSITPAELTDSVPAEPMKAISRLPKVIDESIEPADKPFMDFYKEVVDVKSEAALAPFNVQLKEINDHDVSDEAKKALREPVLKAANEAIAALRVELGVIEKEKELVEVTITSDEKFELVKVLFDKLGSKKFQIVRAMAEIKDAFDGAKEA